MVKIGDTVLYMGKEKCEVLDIAYISHSEGKQHITTAAFGRIHYQILIADAEVETKWVERHMIVGDDTAISTDKEVNDLQVLGNNIISWLDGLPSRPDNMKLYGIITMLSAIQYDKEGSYGSSWKGKGEYRGIMANIDRKYDRLDKITNDEICGKRKPLPTASYNELTGSQVQDIGESKIDAVADLTVYGMLYMTYLKDEYPGAFRVWVAKNVPAYLRDKIPFISE